MIAHHLAGRGFAGRFFDSLFIRLGTFRRVSENQRRTRSSVTGRYFYHGEPANRRVANVEPSQSSATDLE